MEHAERGIAEYRALTDALIDSPAPPCNGDDRFTLDPHDIAAAELDHLSNTVCLACPLRTLCAAYGEAAQPAAGIWAGSTYRPRQRRTAQVNAAPAAPTKETHE